MKLFLSSTIMVSPCWALMVGPGNCPFIVMTSFSKQSGDLSSYFTSHLNRRIFPWTRTEEENRVMKQMNIRVKTWLVSENLQDLIIFLVVCPRICTKEDKEAVISVEHFPTNTWFKKYYILTKIEILVVLLLMHVYILYLIHNDKSCEVEETCLRCLCKKILQMNHILKVFIDFSLFFSLLTSKHVLKIYIFQTSVKFRLRYKWKLIWPQDKMI